MFQMRKLKQVILNLMAAIPILKKSQMGHQKARKGEKRSSLGRHRFSEVKISRGSPICKKQTNKTASTQSVQQFQNIVPKCKIDFEYLISTVHNIIKRLRESGEISVCQRQGQKSVLDVCNLQKCRGHCIENRDASVMEITACSGKLP